MKHEHLMRNNVKIAELLCNIIGQWMLDYENEETSGKRNAVLMQNAEKTMNRRYEQRQSLKEKCRRINFSLLSEMES